MLFYLGLLGVAVFAISGGLAAGRKRLDWIGVITIGIVTALGGGTIRDILLNRDQIFWIANTAYLWVGFASSFLMIFAYRYVGSPTKALVVADALGLALFSILGAQVAEAQGASPIVIVVMGALTGVAGGAIRDVLTGEIPVVFRPTETLYSVAALGGCVVYLVAQAGGVGREVAGLLGTAVVAAIRFGAIAWDIRLPAFDVVDKR